MGTPRVSQKEAVLHTIRQASDLPVMAETIKFIQNIKAFADQNITEIANIILKDYALTAKLLKVVNSVIYLQFGEVTTISRAIFLLGIENIKDISLTLMILDHLQKNSAHPKILDIISQAYLGGFMAEKIVHDLNFVEEEEAFICALLHPLGKILTAFAMPEKIAEIERRGTEKDYTENSASTSVLGISFEEIGVTIATEWNFPSKIIQSMHNTRLSDLTANLGEMEKLRMIATLSTQISNILGTDYGKKEKTVILKKLLNGYKDHIKISENLDRLITAAAQDLHRLGSDLNLNIKGTSLHKQLIDWAGPESKTLSGAEALEGSPDDLKIIETFFPREEEDAETIFSKGIQDINSSILQPFALNDVIRIALETIHRGLKKAGISRTLFFVRDTQKPFMRIRSGFGDRIEEAMNGFVIEITGSKDIFNTAIFKGSDLVIQDISSREIKNLIPSWYQKQVRSPAYLILLPITINKKSIGLVCLEGEQKGFKDISKADLNYLRILRDQIVVAVSQLASEK